MRTNLKVFRVAHKLTQAEMADRIGVSRVTYNVVERGERGGSHYFWANLKFAFDVPDAEMYNLMKLDKDDEYAG